VIATSPPLFSGISGVVISRFLRRIPLIFEVRDIWPESAVVLGLLTNKRIIRFLEKMEESFYKHAARVVVVTSGIAESLAKRGIDKEKIIHISNGVDIESIKPGAKAGVIRKKLGIEDKFVVLYAGTHGVAHGLSTLLEAAGKLKARKEIVFVMIGDGAEKELLKEQAARDKLDNVLFLDPVPKSEIADYIFAADTCVVLLKKLDLFRGAMPSKLYEFMAAEKPILLGINGEARDMLEKAQAGIYFKPEDSDDLAEAVLRMKSNPKLAIKYGKNGRIEARQSFSHETLASKYEHNLNSLLKERPRPNG
jgi:glycosyltransferase involved in cell wall biosynthesis